MPCHSNNYVYPKLYISSININSEKNNSEDELFINILEFDNNNIIIKENRVPQFPYYWNLEALKNLKETQIWTGILKIKEIKTLFIIFKDQDFWSYDDILGFAKLQLYYDGKIIKQEWEIVSTNKSAAKISTHNLEKPYNFKITSDKYLYNVKMGITLNRSLLLYKNPHPEINTSNKFLKPYSGIYMY